MEKRKRYSHNKLGAYQPAQKYFLIDENRISKLLLDKTKGESAYIFRLEQAKNADEILAIAHELAERLKDPKYDLLRRSIYSWISRLLKKKAAIDLDQNIDTVEDTVMLEQRIAQLEEELIQKGKIEGIILGKEEGKEEGILLGKEESILQSINYQKTTMLEMLSDRFGEIPIAWTPIIDCLEDPKIINQLTRAVYKVKSLQEFGDILNNIQ